MKMNHPQAPKKQTQTNPISNPTAGSLMSLPVQSHPAPKRTLLHGYSGFVKNCFSWRRFGAGQV